LPVSIVIGLVPTSAVMVWIFMFFLFSSFFSAYSPNGGIAGRAFGFSGQRVPLRLGGAGFCPAVRAKLSGVRADLQDSHGCFSRGCFAKNV
jgi:hypothetical protein